LNVGTMRKGGGTLGVSWGRRFDPGSRGIFDGEVCWYVVGRFGDGVSGMEEPNIICGVPVGIEDPLCVRVGMLLIGPDKAIPADCAAGLGGRGAFRTAPIAEDVGCNQGKQRCECEE
jgi:hypothetical protein